MSQQPGGRCYVNTLPVPLYIAIPLLLVLIPVVPVTLLWVVGSEKVHDWKDKRKNKKRQKREAAEKEIKLSANDS
ncbi:uncharacterized protein N7473_008801 [Penicillium subrubescens]|uniref:Uncharacterized protein n=1 Tax=Penicillium subrubescens TaxID=1316194 RepID=A0A1Q5UCP3_9EURO|nr:uncharacterized protein N7473_008801 [Penicillium subrubescens]KAJ5886127.1 hypothetical protein N7473_008801 [Penicillium subrubescens]OKP10231.1 hypothetical protein PENSUB_4405 [Penicillium subrubescens]